MLERDVARGARGALFPLFLDLWERPVLVVGAGAVGAQKAQGLVAAGAAVTVVAPEATAAIEAAAERGELVWHRRRFVAEDVDSVYLVVAATADAAVNAEVARAAARRQRFVNAVDDPQNGTAYAAALIRRGPVTVALSSGGRAPAVSRLLRQVLEVLLPEDAQLERWVELAEALRRTWRQEGRPMRVRYRELLRSLLREEEGAAGVMEQGPERVTERAAVRP